jgi:hypothetical protein
LNVAAMTACQLSLSPHIRPHGGMRGQSLGRLERLTLDQTLELDRSHLKRCPECHGQVRLHKAFIDGTAAYFEHYERNPGCSLGDCFDGNPKLHPWPLR